MQHLWKLFHMERELESLQDQIEKDKKASSKFIDTQTQLQEELKKAKKSYAKANKQVLTYEKQIKEKDRERLDLKPEIFEVEESIQHTEKKLATAEENIHDSQVAKEKQVKALKGLERDLAAVQLRITAHESKWSLNIDMMREASKTIDLNTEDLNTYNKL